MDNFEGVLNQHKEKARKVYAESGESNLVNSAMREIESNCADYEYYFQMGQQSKQKRIDELQARLDAVEKLPEFWKDFIIGFPHISSDSKVQLMQCTNELEQALKGGEV